MVHKRETGYLLQDAGLLLLLLSIGVQAILVGRADSTLFPEFIMLMTVSFIAILLAGFKLTSIAVVASGFEVLVYTAYKIFRFYAYSEKIEPICFLWIILPIASTVFMLMFIRGNRQTELENEVLREQVEELVMINPLTGLYNLRSLYFDLHKQSAYAERNSMKLSLMMIQLRYEPELKSILSRRKYEMLLQKLAIVVQDTIRLEDRIYSLDHHGMIGIILMCEQEKCDFVKKRIRSALEHKDTFCEITEKSIKVGVKIAYVEYDKKQFGADMISFKQKVEQELQYDV